MHRVADGVWQLTSFVKDLFNSYLLEDVLVDAGTRWAAGRILGQVRHCGVKLLVLTHCHPDHQGSAAKLCRHLRIPLACHAREVPAMDGSAPMQPDIGIVRFGHKVWSGPDRHVERSLRDGDEVGGFRVVETPGHTPGHLSLFRSRDRLLVAGDVLANVHFFTNKPGLRLPPSRFCSNPMENRQSVVRLAELEPKVICFGHGPPLRDAKTFQLFAERCRRSLRANAEK